MIYNTSEKYSKGDKSMSSKLSTISSKDNPTNFHNISFTSIEMGEGGYNLLDLTRSGRYLHKDILKSNKMSERSSLFCFVVKMKEMFFRDANLLPCLRVT